VCTQMGSMQYLYSTLTTLYVVGFNIGTGPVVLPILSTGPHLFT
jgi:hypothetical protein